MRPRRYAGGRSGRAHPVGHAGERALALCQVRGVSAVAGARPGAQRLRPDDADVLNLLGLVYFKTNAFPEAEGIYRRLTLENPNVFILHSNLGLILFKQGKYDEALEDYVNSCRRGDKLRIAAYEFHYEPFLALLKQAKAKGVIQHTRRPAARWDNGHAAKDIDAG